MARWWVECTKYIVPNGSFGHPAFKYSIPMPKDRVWVELVDLGLVYALNCTICRDAFCTGRIDLQKVEQHFKSRNHRYWSQCNCDAGGGEPHKTGCFFWVGPEPPQNSQGPPPSDSQGSSASSDSGAAPSGQQGVSSLVFCDAVVDQSFHKPLSVKSVLSFGGAVDQMSAGEFFKHLRQFDTYFCGYRKNGLRVASAEENTRHRRQSYVHGADVTDKGSSVGFLRKVASSFEVVLTSVPRQQLLSPEVEYFTVVFDTSGDKYTCRVVYMEPGGGRRRQLQHGCNGNGG